MIKKNGCMVFGKELVFFEAPKMLECAECEKKFPTDASCQDGHFICNECHA